MLQYTSILRNCLDILHAGSTLPKGILWGCQLKAWLVGLIATISSVLGIYQFFIKRNM